MKMEINVMNIDPDKKPFGFIMALSKAMTKEFDRQIELCAGGNPAVREAVKKARPKMSVTWSRAFKNAAANEIVDTFEEK